MTMSLRELLAKHTVEALPLPADVACIDSTATAGAAFQVLMEQHVLSAPIVEAGKGIGLVDMADFVAFIVSLLPESRVYPESEMEKLNKDLSEAPIKKIISMCFGRCFCGVLIFVLDRLLGH